MKFYFNRLILLTIKYFQNETKLINSPESNVKKVNDSDWLKNLQAQAIAENQKATEKTVESKIERKNKNTVQAMDTQRSINNDIMGGILKDGVRTVIKINKMFKKLSSENNILVMFSNSVRQCGL